MAPHHFLMALAVPVIWGMGIVFAKAALGLLPADPADRLSFRRDGAGAGLVRQAALGLMGKIALIALVSVTIQYSLTFTGLKHLDASVTVLVVQLEVPILILLGAVFLGERPSLRKYAGIALTFLSAWP